MQVHTVGDEFTQFYAVWRQIQRLPVYIDRFSPPYYYAIYNFLFYYSYGLVTESTLDFFMLADSWLLTIARLLSLSAMLVGVYACYVCCAKARGDINRRSHALAFAFLIFSSLWYNWSAT